MILDEKYSQFYLLCITDSIVSNPLLKNDMIESIKQISSDSTKGQNNQSHIISSGNVT